MRNQWMRSFRCLHPCWRVVGVSRASATDSSWRPSSSTGTRTAWAVICVAVGWGRWAVGSTINWEESCVGEIISGFLARTVSALPVKRGSEHLRWRCVCGTRFTIWSASSAPPARSTSVWVIATFSSTQTLCVSRTSLSGPSSTIIIWFRRISSSRWVQRERTTDRHFVANTGFVMHLKFIMNHFKKRGYISACLPAGD